MKSFILILFMALMITACKKSNESPYQSQGIITGEYLGPCYSLECGGLEITIKNDPTKNPPPFYYINSTLPQLGISASMKFPINVSLTWSHDTTATDYIIVSNVKVLN